MTRKIKIFILTFTLLFVCLPETVFGENITSDEDTLKAERVVTYSLDISTNTVVTIELQGVDNVINSDNSDYGLINLRIKNGYDVETYSLDDEESDIYNKDIYLKDDNSVVIKKTLKKGSYGFSIINLCNSNLNYRINFEYNESLKSPKTIKFNQNSISLKPLESYTLNPVLTPAKADTSKIFWISSDNLVAAVDNNGKIVAKKEGNCTITAKLPNGKKANIRVKVRA